jgi:hypothetical protein
MSMFDNCLVFDHLTHSEELAVQMLVAASDQWEAMDIVDGRVQKALRRLALVNCRTRIVHRQLLT